MQSYGDLSRLFGNLFDTRVYQVITRSLRRSPIAHGPNPGEASGPLPLLYDYQEDVKRVTCTSRAILMCNSYCVEKAA